MKNIEMIQQVYTDLSQTLYDAGGDVVNAKTYKQIDEILDTVDKISVILKRLGETAIMEIGDELIGNNGGEQSLEQYVEEIDVRKNTKEGDE